MNWEWELKEVSQTEWQQDKTGLYTYIHYIKNNIVRLDIMDKYDTPVISFQGTADNVRKHVMQMPDWDCISIEHASYIGAELARCALQGTEYIQD